MDRKTIQWEAPRRWERWAVALVLVVLVVFGCLVEYRSAFLSRRMGDLGCYLRAAWAVRAGVDMYGIVEDNGWHYNYPPLYAILLAPLADPPKNVDHTGFVPYAVSVALVYLFNLCCLALGIHALASALEKASADPLVRSLPVGRRRWWALRLLPLVACVVPIGHTLMRGQANLLLLALICGLIAGLMRGRHLVAGLCLAGAISLKIFPGFLLLVPLWRRDWRCLGGCALGLLLFLVLIPLGALGPARFVSEYKQLGIVLVGPALNLGHDKTRANELIDVNATDNQSIRTVLHNTLHLDPDTRPKIADPEVRLAGWLIGGVLTLLTLAAAWRRRRDNGPAVALFVGSLTVVMIALSPVCHTHYFTLLLPLTMTLLARSWEHNLGNLHRWAALNPGMLALVMLQIVSCALPVLDNLKVTHDLGLSLYTALFLWLLACATLVRRDQEMQPEQRTTRELSSAVAA
jgi:alpha-1,2-mannosyltransferase